MKQRGFTLIELVIVVAIVGVLASAALPLARWSVKRTKEYQLQQNLRIIRNAIDRYHDAAQAGLIEISEGETGYPPRLDVLVEGVQLIGQMPPVMPGVSDEYGATGPGLTGGLAGQLPQESAGGSTFGGSGSPGGMAGPAGFGGSGSPGQSPDGRSDERTGPRWTFGMQSGTSGSDAGRPSILGGSAGGGARQGGQRQEPGVGSSFGSQTSMFDRGSSLSPGATAAEPLLGPDGQPVKVMFLRRLPVDPFTGKAEWGMRCYGEPPTDSLWCGRDVFDVYSKSIAAAIDGSKYKDW